MVYKKYIKRGGKRYGPYLYKNERINGKVVTSYLGQAKEKEISYNGKRFFKKTKFLHHVLPFLISFLIVFFLFYHG